MGNMFATDSAKQTELRVRNEFEEKRKTLMAEQQEKERQEQERLRKEAADKVENEKKLLEREIEEESGRNLEEARKKVASFNERKAAGEKRIDEIHKELKENTDAYVEILKNEGVGQVTESKEQLQKEKADLVKEKEHLTYELNRLHEAKEESVKEEGKMKEEMREKERESKELHEKEILGLSTKLGEVQLEREQRLGAMTVEQAELQKQIAAEHKKLEGVWMQDSYALMDCLTKEQKFEDFRRNARRMIGLFNNFKGQFDGEERYLISTRDEIEQGIPVTMAPDFSYTSRALRSFLEELQQFSVEGSTEPDTFETLQETVRDLVNQLQTAINTTVSRIQGYENACKKAPEEAQSSEPEEPEDQQGEERKKKMRVVSMTPSEIEEFDVLTNSPQPEKRVISGKPRAKKPYTKASQRYDISELYKQIKKLIEQLSTEILKFNVRASTAFDDTLNRQSTSLQARVQGTEPFAQLETSSTTVPAVEMPPEEQE